MNTCLKIPQKKQQMFVQLRITGSLKYLKHDLTHTSVLINE